MLAVPLDRPIVKPSIAPTVIPLAKDPFLILLTASASSNIAYIFSSLKPSTGSISFLCSSIFRRSVRVNPVSIAPTKPPTRPLAAPVKAPAPVLKTPKGPRLKPVEPIIAPPPAPAPAEAKAAPATSSESAKEFTIVDILVVIPCKK